MARQIIPEFVKLAFETIDPFEKCPLCAGAAPACYLIRETSHDTHQNKWVTEQTRYFLCRTENVQIIQNLVEEELISTLCSIFRNGYFYVINIDFKKQRTTVRKTRCYAELGSSFSVTGCRVKFFLSESLDELCDSYDKFFNFA